MLGMNKNGQLVNINQIDPLTGARSLDSINNASPTTNVVLSHESQIAQEEQNAQYAQGLEYTKAQQRDRKRARIIAKKEKELADYNKKILYFQRSAQTKEKTLQQEQGLTLEAAIRDFQQNPVDPSILADPGFYTVAAQGRAAMAPVTDYEKVLQRTAIGVDPVIIDHNPLGSIDFNQGEILNTEGYHNTMEFMYKNAIRNVGDEYSVRNAEDFSNDQGQENQQAQAVDSINGLFDIDTEALVDQFNESVQTEAQKAINKEVATLINPPKTATAAATTTVVVAHPPTTSIFGTPMTAQTKQLLTYGAIALGGFAALMIVVKVVKK